MRAHDQTIHILGKPSAPKPVRGGACAGCGKITYKQRFTPGREGQGGWRYLCVGCEPPEQKITLAQRNWRGGVPISYGNDYGERSTRFDPALGRAIRASRGQRG